MERGNHQSECRMLSADWLDSGLLQIRAEGRLTAGDYEQFEGAFAKTLDGKSKPLPLLLDLTRFRGWTLAGLLRDVRFDLRNWDTFSKIAVLGSRRWHKWLAFAAVPVFAAQIRFFWSDKQRLAEAWLLRQH